MEDIRKKLILLVFLLFLVTADSFFANVSLFTFGAPPPSQPKTLGDQIRAGVAPIPALTPSTKQKLAKSHSFQALVSYTDQGFEPMSLKVKAGDMIRFTNNSSHPMWVAAYASAGQTLYPSVQNGCGASALDSCTPIAPQDFWEFTFDAKGTWGVTDNLDKTKSGSVHVN